MTIQDAIDGLAAESQRFTEIVRGFDGGIWWSSDETSKIDVEAIQAQVTHIRIALDEIARLAKKMAE